MSRFPCRLLVDLPNWLGDFIHALPALELLLEANRGGETTLLMPREHVPLATFLPVRSRVRPLGASLGFGRSLRGFDLALTFRHSTRAKLLLAALPGGEKWASVGRGSTLLGLRTFGVDRLRHQRHDFDCALVALGLAPVDGRPVRLLLPTSLKANQSPVVLLPGSRGTPEKRYPPLRYLEVGRALKKRGLPVWVVVGPNDAGLGQWLARELGGLLVNPWASLGEVAEVLAGARLAIGNDSGLTHLAAAVGCSTVAVFGPTSPARTAPFPGVVVQAVEFTSRGWECLPSEDVLRACEGMLAWDLPGGRRTANMNFGGGPLAQLAEQGTLNP